MILLRRFEHLVALAVVIVTCCCMKCLPGVGAQGSEATFGTQQELATNTSTNTSTSTSNTTISNSPTTTNTNSNSTTTPTSTSTSFTVVPTNATTTPPVTSTPDTNTSTSLFPADEMCFFTMQYGFDAGLDRAPTREEIEELICITNRFMTWQTHEYLSTNKKETRPVQIFATNLHWHYHAGEPLSIDIRFTADAAYSTSAFERVSKEDMFDAFELTEGQIAEYITNWVWQVNFHSIFYSVIRVNYNVKRTGTGSETETASAVMLPEASCPETRAPTDAPLFTEAPSTSPSAMVSNVSTNATTTSTVAPNATDSMVYFRMDVTMNGRNNVTSQDDIKSLMCHVNEYFEHRLQLGNNNNEVTSIATNIEWITSDSDVVSHLVVYFTSNTTNVSSGELVPMEVVATAVNDTHDALYFFMTTTTLVLSNTSTSTSKAGSTNNIFQHGSNQRYLLLMNDLADIALEALPLGTPVRVGMLDVADCTYKDGMFILTPTSVTNLDGPLSSTLVPTIGSPLDVSPSNSSNNNNTMENPSKDPTRGPDNIGNMDNNNGGSGTEDTANPQDPGSSSSSSNDTTTSSSILIDVSFIVSNLDFITEPDEIIHQGLNVAFTIFVENLLRALMTMQPIRKNLLLRRRRSLQGENIVPGVTLDATSATVYIATQVPCGPFTHGDLTCHRVKARYSILPNKDPTPESLAEMHRMYEVETYKALNDGTLNTVLRQQVPDTSLFIGTIPSLRDGSGNGNDDDGKLSTTDWLMIVLLILVGILCCWFLACVGHLCWINCQRRKEEKQQQLELDEQYQKEMTRQEEKNHNELMARDNHRNSISNNDESLALTCRSSIVSTSGLGHDHRPSNYSTRSLSSSRSPSTRPSNYSTRSLSSSRSPSTRFSKTTT